MENLFFIYILGQGNIMKKIILGAFILCGVLSADCVRNSNGTVSCSETKLMWQDDKNAKTIKKDWESAKKYCKNLKFAGYSDWRLPSIKELFSIVNHSAYSPAINSAFKNTTLLHYYWSTTSYAYYTSLVWNVNFGNGHTDYYNKLNKNAVRCVRAKN